MIVLSVIIYLYILKTSHKNDEESVDNRKSIELNDTISRIQEQQDFQQKNPAFDKSPSLLSIESAHNVDTHFFVDESGEEITIGYPKLHILLKELKLLAFKDAFVAHGIHTTKQLVEQDDEKIMIEVGLRSLQRKRILAKIHYLKEKAKKDMEMQKNLHKEPSRNGWKKRFSVVSGKEYFEHLESGKTQWDAPLGTTFAVEKEVPKNPDAVHVKNPLGDEEVALSVTPVKETAEGGKREPEGEEEKSSGEDKDKSPATTLPIKPRNPTIIPQGWSRETTEDGDKYYVDPDGNGQWARPPGN